MVHQSLWWSRISKNITLSTVILLSTTFRMSCARSFVASAAVSSSSSWPSPSSSSGKNTSEAEIIDPKWKYKVYIALGSNLGDRSRNLLAGMEEMKQFGHIQCTSFLYQSIPMYYTEQPAFLNAACQLHTNLEPNSLLQALKQIETSIGRVESFRNGPRALDLDILLYDNLTFTAEHLHIPHIRMHERAFVLKPLLDMNPHLYHPTLQQSIQEMYEALPKDAKQELRQVIPCFNYRTKLTNYLYIDNKLPILMGILNVTPDSFSDGGQFNASVEAAVEQAKKLVNDGAQIIDIGGESTRPKADYIEIEEEIRRVEPVIRAIRDAGLQCLISIDTRKAAVAKAAIAAGADMINDVSAGDHDPMMFKTVAELQVPYIAMHMRGDPSNMLDKKYSTYNDAVEDVLEELKEKVDRLDALIPRWLQIVDPGIGFAKGLEENMSLLKPAHLQHFKKRLSSRPLLIGLSRKRFLNKVQEGIVQERKVSILADNELRSASNNSIGDFSPSLETRDLSSAGAHCAAILGGANIIRVHNVKATQAVCDAFTSIL